MLTAMATSRFLKHLAEGLAGPGGLFTRQSVKESLRTAVVAALVATIVGCTGATTASPPASPSGSTSRPATAPPGSSLPASESAFESQLTQRAGGIAFDTTDARAPFALELSAVDDDMFFYGDPRLNLAGMIPTATLVHDWWATSAQHGSVVAALMTEGAPGGDLVTLLQLEHPVFDAASHTMRYRATPVDQSDDLPLFVGLRHTSIADMKAASAGPFMLMIHDSLGISAPAVFTELAARMHQLIGPDAEKIVADARHLEATNATLGALTELSAAMGSRAGSMCSDGTVSATAPELADEITSHLDQLAEVPDVAGLPNSIRTIADELRKLSPADMHCPATPGTAVARPASFAQNTTTPLAFSTEDLWATITAETDAAKAQLAAIQAKLEAVSVADMFEMQTLMNRLSELSEMSSAIVSAANSALSSMERNVKG